MRNETESGGRTTFKDLLYLLKRCRSVEEAKGRNKEAKTSNFRHRKWWYKETNGKIQTRNSINEVIFPIKRRINHVDTISRQLKHKNIVEFKAAVHDVKNLAILVEFMEGGTLKTLLSNKSVKLSFSQQLQMAIDVAAGMVYLHGLSPPIIHRDLKPENLLLSKDLQLKISDFGSSAFSDQTKENKGTPFYMA